MTGTLETQGYAPVFNQGFNAWMGPIWVRLGDDPMGPHHYILDVRAEHLNGGGFVHGGALMAFTDIVLGSTIANAVGGMGATMSLNCDFLAGAKPGMRIEGEARITRLTKTVAFVSGRLYSGDTTILTASGVWKVGERIEGFSIAGTSWTSNFGELPTMETETGGDWPRWIPPRQVTAPKGYVEQRLGDPFEAWLGPYFEREGGAETDDLDVTFIVDDRHVNARGICHGGALMTFADATQGGAAWRAGRQNTVTLSFQSNFLKAAKVGDVIRTRPRVTRKTPSIPFVESAFEIEGQIVFTASGLFKVIGR